MNEYLTQIREYIPSDYWWGVITGVATASLMAGVLIACVVGWAWCSLKKETDYNEEEY